MVALGLQNIAHKQIFANETITWKSTPNTDFEVIS